MMAANVLPVSGVLSGFATMTLQWNVAIHPGPILWTGRYSAMSRVGYRSGVFFVG